MDKSTWIGLIIGLIAIGVGMVLKGVSLMVLVNPTAILIIFLGTAASVIVAFPTSEIKRVPKIFGILFDSGQAVVRKESEKVSLEVASLLVMNPPRNIIISGHTDNIPIRNKQFESNWELSVFRAVNFMKLLLENTALNPADFSAKGFGEFKPVESNKTSEGRAKNRRVEVLILPRTN